MDNEHILFSMIVAVLKASLKPKYSNPMIVSQRNPSTFHEFRLEFAFYTLQIGTDSFTLANLMGHKGITVLQRYLRETKKDTKIAHRQASPVDIGLYKSH